MRRYLRWARVEIDYLAYRTGLRGYCFQHDVARWYWTHRDCCARQRAVAAAISKYLNRPGSRRP